AVRESRAAAMEKYREEVQAVREGIERVQYYQSKNDLRSAQDVIQRLATTYPNDPAVIFLTQKDSLGTAVADARAMTDLMGKRYVAAMNSVQRSAIPIAGDIEFPPDWKDKTERRKKMFELKLTPREKSLIEALDKAVSLTVIGRPLQEVLQDLADQMGQQILVD